MKKLLKNWKRNLFDLVLIVVCVVFCLLLGSGLISFDKNINLAIISLEARLNPLYYSGYETTCGDWTGEVDVETLAGLLLVEDWHGRDEHSQEECRMTVRLGEEWELSIYESYAEIYYGYTSIGESDTAYYSIPSEVADNIEEFLLEVDE